MRINRAALRANLCNRHVVRLRAVAGLVALALSAMPAVGAAEASFSDWREGLRAEAVGQGVDPALFDAALDGVSPIDRIVELDQRQPEFTQTFWRYLDSRVNAARIGRGAQLLRQYAGLLEAVQRHYGVQPRFLVAFWGLESNYGDDTGSFPLTAALATLAYDGRRSGFFRQQLLTTLQLMQRGDVPLAANASWAGAFGQTQFMPSTFQSYAVDFDGDGVRNLWHSLPDIFASSAHYLASIGWDGGSTWGREVLVPYGFDYAVSGLERELPLAEWSARGVMSADGSPLPETNLNASLLLPGGADGGPAFLVYSNFRKIMNWNNSVLYAVAVGHLADRLAGGGPLLTPRPYQEVAMSRSEIIEMQERLARFGLDTGGSDGLVGVKTREAIRTFQQWVNLPADGYPSPPVLYQLREKTMN
jgi:membrane-bound lytic murein transglycosylase B